MRKLRTSVLALTTIASLTLGGTAVAGAETANGSADKVTSSSSKNEEGQKGSSDKITAGSSKKEEGQKGSSDKITAGSSKKEDGQKGSAKNLSSSAKKDAPATDGTDTEAPKNNGSLDAKKGWIPGHSFGSTLQTDYVPAWAKVWMAVVAIVGIVTAGLFAAPGITALRAHHIIP